MVHIWLAERFCFVTTHNDISRINGSNIGIYHSVRRAKIGLLMEYYAEFFTKMSQIGWLQSFWILLPSIGTVAAFGFFGYSHKNESIKSILCIAAVIAGIIFVPIDFYYKADAKNKETRYEQIVEIDRINTDSDVIVDRLRKIIDSETSKVGEDKSELVQLYAQLGAVTKFVQLHLGDINLPINKKLSTIESNLNTQYEKIVNDVPVNLKEFKDTLSEMKATVDENKIFIEQIKAIIEQQTLPGDINKHNEDLGNYESKEQTGTEIENSPSKHESLVVAEEPDSFKIEDYKNVLEKLNVLQNTTSRRQSIDKHG